MINQQISTWSENQTDHEANQSSVRHLQLCGFYELIDVAGLEDIEAKQMTIQCRVIAGLGRKMILNKINCKSTQRSYVTDAELDSYLNALMPPVPKRKAIAVFRLSL